MQSTTLHACSVKYDRVVPILLSKVSISQAFTPTSTIISGKNLKEFQAIWDTGATNSVITEKVVKSCDLKPIGMAKVNTASGEDEANVYLVSIYLPNKVCIPQLRVSELKINNADVLIGMDVIHRGDFAITNNEGKTMLSFRLPSIDCIDFTKQQPTTIQSGGKTLTKVGRNALCPCGSGKKYKHCCGK